MNILITNDDGYNSEGIRALFDGLSSKHNVFIVAPMEEKSACSNAITIRNDIIVDKIEDGIFSVNGFTADCVNVGLNSGIIPPVDLVISGINHGPNLGDDVHFSGTVAGARTAYIFGVSGIAISLDCLETSSYFNEAARFLLGFIDTLKQHPGSDRYFFNINYPDLPSPEIPGEKYTTLGRRRYNDSFTVDMLNDERMHLRMLGTIESDEIAGSDASELRNGYISITPLTIDATDYKYLEISR